MKKINRFEYRPKANYISLYHKSTEICIITDLDVFYLIEHPLIVDLKMIPVVSPSIKITRVLLSRILI